MKNKIIYILKSKIKINIKGKNINRFITRLYNNKIEILKCKIGKKCYERLVLVQGKSEKMQKRGGSLWYEERITSLIRL